MHTKFRPIVTENARKTNSGVSKPTETASTKLVKPIAISARVKPEKPVPQFPNHENESNSVPLLKPLPVTDGLNTALDQQRSESSVGNGHDSLYTHNSAPVKAVFLEDVHTRAKRARSLDHAVVAGTLNIPERNQDDDDNAKDIDECMLDVEEGRPDSGNSQEQVGTTNTQHSTLPVPEKEIHLTFCSNDSAPSSKESENPERFFKAQDSEERAPCATKFELEWDTNSHRLVNDGFDGNLPIPSGDTGTEVHNSSDDSNSSDPLLVGKVVSHEVPQFSDVLESEDSSRSEPQELVRNKGARQGSVPSPSSFASSTEESFDEVRVISRMRKTSSGTRMSLRHMELKKKSTGGSHDSSENPWFHNRSINKEDQDEEISSIENETVRTAKGKKKKLGMFTRLLRTAKNGEKRDKDNSMDSSEEMSLRASLSDDSSIPPDDVKPSRDASEEHLEATLSLAISGKRNLEEVIDALLGLSERPCDKVMKLLTKYMGSAVVIDAVFMVILEHQHAKKADIPMKSMAPSHARYSPHREALINLFANGPRRLKKALLNHNKARSEILRFFTEDRPDGDGEIPYWTSTATGLGKILNGLLAQFPTELSEYIGGKKGVLHLMIKNHVHVPEVVEFVIQLSAANALSRTTGEDLRYGAANATGLVLLVKEGICDLLVDIFRKSSIATAQGNAHLLEWQTQVMSSHCLLELSKRAVVTPRFSKDNCSYSGRHIKTLNSSLEDLSLFVNDARVLSLLNAGFEAVSDGREIENIREQIERNNPLVCALTTITELLETVRVAAGSKLGVTRNTVGSTSTEKIENHLISKMARLCKLLHRKSAHEVSCRAKVAIVNVFRCLCSSKIESTRLSMVKSQIPDRLMVLIRENEKSSVLHSCVLKCVSASFNSAHSIELHKEWLRALARSDGWLQVMYEYFHKVREGKRHGYKPFFNTFVAIGFRLIDFCQDDKESKLRPMLKTKAEQQTFVDSIEAGLIRMRKEYETPCGGPKPSERAVSVLANAESLAARLHDFNAV